MFWVAAGILHPAVGGPGADVLVAQLFGTGWDETGTHFLVGPVDLCLLVFFLVCGIFLWPALAGDVGHVRP